MTNMIYFFALSTLIFQVLALETDNIRLANDTEATNRRLFGINPITACMSKLNIPSAATPLLASAMPLTRLANGRVYFFSPALPVATHASWSQARDYCSRRGMHLVTLETARENQLVFAQATALGIANGAAAPGAWIGIRETGLNDWRWVLRDTHPTYTTYSIFPTAALPCGSYIAAAGTLAASWAPVACVGPLPFICEMEPPCSALVSAVNA